MNWMNGDWLWSDYGAGYFRFAAPLFCGSSLVVGLGSVVVRERGRQDR